MKLGFVGLGRMGYNMVLNLLEHKHTVVVNNRSPEPTQKAAKDGGVPSYSLQEMIEKLPFPKIIWLMVPAGKPVDYVISQCLPFLQKDDIIIDGGNSYFEDSQRRYKELRKRGIHFLDCGTSGGVSGARHGACMMVGGDEDTFKEVEALFRDMCVKDGYGYMGTSGAGHFVKMVHNGIEYGMMAAIAEGIQTIKEAPFKIDLDTVVRVYAHGSIIQSRLLDWLQQALEQKNYLNKISGEVPKGETEEEMEKLEKIADMPVLHQARLMRIKTRTKPTYAGKLIAAMRNQFGGHSVIEE